MTAQPLQSTGPFDLLDKVRLNLSLDGRQIYDGRVRGDEGNDMIRNALELGEYAYGDSGTMVITLTVDKDMKLFYEKSAADIRWHFYAVKDEPADPPKTGETIRNYLLALAAALTIGTFILIAVRKKQKEDRYNSLCQVELL
jgi:LPXTG-motif cell wall-anchored protein